MPIAGVALKYRIDCRSGARPAAPGYCSGEERGEEHRQKRRRGRAGSDHLADLSGNKKHAGCVRCRKERRKLARPWENLQAELGRGLAVGGQALTAQRVSVCHRPGKAGPGSGPTVTHGRQSRPLARRARGGAGSHAGCKWPRRSCPALLQRRWVRGGSGADTGAGRRLGEAALGRIFPCGILEQGRRC